MSSGRRHERMQEFIQRTLGSLVQEYIRPDVLVSITQVQISVDFQWADVSVSIFPYDKHEEMMAFLARRAGLFQALLNKSLRIKHTPKIRFILDSRLEAGIIEDN